MNKIKVKLKYMNNLKRNHLTVKQKMSTNVLILQ